MRTQFSLTFSFPIFHLEKAHYMRTRITSFFLTKIVLLAFFAALPSILNADTFDSETAFDDATCGEFVNDDLNFGQDNTQILDRVLTTNWGTFEIGEPFTGNFGVNLDGDNLILVPDTPAALVFDGTQNVEGVAVTYFGSEGQLCITLADGTTVVETIPPTTDPNDFTPQFFGWTNTTGQEVTAVSIKATNTSPDDSEAIALSSIGFSFGEICDTAPTCQDQLQDIIDNLFVKLDSASPSDQVWIEEAIYRLGCAQDPALWVSENRLSDYGTVFFGHNFYATYFLECVYDDDLVEDCLINIQGLLGCVVDAEIDYALENPDANSNLLAYAECFEEYAEAFADAELYLNAVLLHFYAWLFASNA